MENIGGKLYLKGRLLGLNSANRRRLLFNDMGIINVHTQKEAEVKHIP